MFKNRQRLAAICTMLLCFAVLCGTAWALLDDLVWPEASGEAVDISDKLTIDYSHIEQGYVMVHGPVSDKRLKLQVQKDNNGLNYDLNSKGEWEIIPLQFGNGNYTFTLAIQASGQSYSMGGRLAKTVEFEDPNSVFLIPNQYVYYDPETPAIAKSEELCEGLTTDEEKFEAIRTYIHDNYEYDFAKVPTVTAGMLPSVEYAWEHGMGICQDLSALAACMLRVQGIPTHLEIGYVGGNYYHAWNSVYLGGEWVRYDPTLELNAIPQGYSYRLERYY